MSKLKRRLFGSRFIAGSWSAFACIMVIVIAIFANLVVSGLPSTYTQFDMTENGLYTLSDQSKRIAASVTGDVTLYLLASSGQEDATIMRLLNEYAAQSSHIHVETVDPNERPTFLNAYDFSTYQLYQNSVIVDASGRYRLVGYNEIYVTDYDFDYSTYAYSTTTTFDGENALTNAIHYTTSDNLPTIYLLSGHGEQELDEDFEDMLAQDNYTTATLSLLSLEAVPEDASAVLIQAPSSDLADDETDVLISYLLSGGHVLLLTDYLEADTMPNLLRLTKAMGLTVAPGIIIEGDRNMRITRYPHYILPNMESHDITQALIDGGYYILTPIAQPLSETDDTDAQITFLLTTSSQAFAKQAGLQMTTTEREDGDTDGPFHVGAISEKGGTLVWFTSGSMLYSSIDRTVAGANSNLVLNALGLMTEQEETISIRAKSLDEDGLILTSSASGLLSVIMIGVIPACLIVLGIVIYVRRKRR